MTLQNPLCVNEEFVFIARERSQLWRILVTLVVATISYLLLTIVIFIVGAAFLSVSDQSILAQGKFTTPQLMTVILISFWGMFVGIVGAVAIFHRRGLGSLLNHRGAFFLRNFIIAVVFVGILFVITNTLFPTQGLRANIPYDVWLSWLPYMLFLVLIQVSAEELIFRGYIQQQLAARFQSPWIWMVLPSIIFGMLHYQPSVMGSNTWFAVAQTMMLGLLMADLTMRTGNLGAAIGLHFANNVLAMGYVSLDGILSGFSLYIFPIDPKDEDALRPLLITEVGSTVVMLLVYAFVVHRWFRK